MVTRRWVGSVVAVVAIVAMTGYLATQRDVLDAIRAIPPWSAAVLVVVAALGLVVQAMQYRVAVAIHEVEMPLGEAVALTAANAMANYYLPARGGMVVRAAYMKRVYRFPLAQYGALTVSITGLTILVSAMIGVVGAVALAVGDGGVNASALATFTGIGLAVVLATVAAVALADRVRGEGRLASVVRGFREGMEMWIGARANLAVFAVWTVALFAVQGFRLWLAFRAIGVGVGVSEMMVIQGLAAVAFVLALTPGNIGIKEGAVVFAASLLGIDPELALLASLVDRAAVLIVTFGVGLGSVRYLSRRTTEGDRSVSSDD